MLRTARVQGAIVRDGQVLLIQHREHNTRRGYWLLPGGAPQVGETDQDALRREIKEETHLDVDVERLLFDDAAEPDRVYTRFKTYLCCPRAGLPRQGAEPEPDVAVIYSIVDVMWLDLRDETTWPSAIIADRWTYPLLTRLRLALDAA